MFVQEGAVSGNASGRMSGWYDWQNSSYVEHKEGQVIMHQLIPLRSGKESGRLVA